jgi:hypothetical protein
MAARIADRQASVSSWPLNACLTPVGAHAGSRSVARHDRPQS